MANLSYQTTIAIDTRRSTVHLFSMLGKGEEGVEHYVKNYSGGHFNEPFFDRFKEVLAEFSAETPSKSVRKVSLILPDSAVALDTVNVPTMRGRGATKNALNLTLGEIYSNFPELKVQSYIAAQNKQYTTFSTAAVQKKVLTALYSACSENKLLVDTTTYAASSSVAAVSALNPKLKNANYLFLDIKDTYARFVFVIGGRAVGFYTLPFGLEFLGRPKYVQEDMLFDHTMGELTVLNAREKAKAKRLSVLAEAEEGAAEETPAEETEPVAKEETAEPDENAEDAEEGENRSKIMPEGIAEAFAMTEGAQIKPPKYMAKKTPRKLPKFMQRPIPETEEGVICENFRVFMKWALSLIAANEKTVQLGRPEFVCVNLPEHLRFLVDYANSQQEEGEIAFRDIGAEGKNAQIMSNLELYGGFFPRNIHLSNKF